MGSASETITVVSKMISKQNDLFISYIKSSSNSIIQPYGADNNIKELAFMTYNFQQKVQDYIIFYDSFSLSNIIFVFQPNILSFVIKNFDSLP
jgi:hypothetical protein